jgi:sulfur-oxidizing protein SoxY
MDMQDRQGATRRAVVLAATGAGMAYALAIRSSAATPASMQAAIRGVVGEASVRTGKVAIDIPPIVENGNTVPLTISVESPMTAADHVKAIHVFNEKNPQPNVLSAHLGPRAGRAKISTRIRLADTQTITAIAELSDGSFWSAIADVIVTIAACVEDL